MGRDKALLPWQGTTLLDHAIARMRAVLDDVRVLCGPAARYEDRGLPLVLDSFVDAGPLGGLDAALGAADGRPVLLLGVDLPFVTPVLLHFLIGSLHRGDHDAVVPAVGGRPEPLCAAYGPACREAVRMRLEAGVRRMTGFFEDVRVRVVEVTPLDGHGDLADLFRNLNTPEDFRNAGG
jgi:molybdopterin-guanine dinucleotide biosynthesis protein A